MIGNEAGLSRGSNDEMACNIDFFRALSNRQFSYSVWWKSVLTQWFVRKYCEENVLNLNIIHIQIKKYGVQVKECTYEICITKFPNHNIEKDKLT